MKVICHKCKNIFEIDKRPMPKDVCEKCNAYLRCCLNCKFYSEGSHNKCKIPNTEWVRDREKANYCDEFEYKIYEEEKLKEKDAKSLWNSLW